MTTNKKAATAKGGRRLTPKQEAFCLAYLETGSASEAYRQAYSSERMKTETINRKAKELLDNGKITARVSELQNAHVERHKITVDDLLLELEENRQLAIKEGQAAAANGSTMGKAKLLGLDKQILEHTGKDGGAVQVVTMTPEDIKRVIEDDDC